MLIMATLPSTSILYLRAVLVWQWYNWLYLSETCLEWQRRSKVPPNARCVPLCVFTTQKVNVQRIFTNKFLLFMVTLWIGKMWRSGAVNSPKEVRRRWWDARRSHNVVRRAGGSFLWLGDTEAGSKTSEMFGQCRRPCWKMKLCTGNSFKVSLL